jgi:DNA-binding transcriptional LysR family regulator
VDRLDAMQVFVRVIEKGSFSAVAKERGIGQPAVSKQIFALEDKLGTELVHRTSRSIALTEAGRDFYESALRILDDFESATSRIGRGQTTPKGLIRLTIPPTFARLHMVSKLAAFFCCVPRLRWPHRKVSRNVWDLSARSGTHWSDEVCPESGTSPFYEECQRFHRDLLIRPRFCRSSAPQLRLRFIRR